MNVVEARPGGDSSRHHLRQFGGGSNRAGLHNRSRNTARLALFSKLENQIGQISFLHPVHQPLGRQVGVRTHSHVQRPLPTQAEPASGVFELQRAHPEVG